MINSQIKNAKSHHQRICNMYVFICFEAIKSYARILIHSCSIYPQVNIVVHRFQYPLKTMRDMKHKKNDSEHESCKLKNKR